VRQLESNDKIIINQDVRICVNIWTTLYIALPKINCKGFSNTNYYLLVYYILTCLHLIYITVSHWIYCFNFYYCI